MGRPAHISGTDLIAAATRVCARQGPGRASVAAIAREAGVPVGSVYHRLPSRAALLAEVWIAAAEGFAASFRERLRAAQSPGEAVEAALAAPRFARDHHAAAVVLFAHRRDEFTAGAPEETRRRAAASVAALQDELAEAAGRLLPGDPRGRERIAVALLGLPHGAVRVFLPQAVPPATLDPVIAAAVRAALSH